MADVIIIYQSGKPVPMILTQSHIDKIKKCISGEVYWCANEEDAFAKELDGEVLFLWGAQGDMPERFCEKSQKLKWVHTFSAGYNALMDSSIYDLPLKITNAKGVMAKTMALSTIGYIIDFLRCFPETYRNQQKHLWSNNLSVIPGETEGKRLLIIGAGAIGGEVAKYAKMLDMHVTGMKRTVHSLPYYDEILGMEDLDDSINLADFVLVLTPLTKETRNLINSDRLAKMKSTAYLINISRGPVVDENALIEALQSRKIAGAALDTTVEEPLSSDSPLWDLDNVIITPHISAVSEKYIDRAVDQFCENLVRFESGEELLNLIR